MNIFIMLLFLTLVITPIINWAQDVYKIISTDKFQTLQSISAASEVRVGTASQSPRVHNKCICTRASVGCTAAPCPAATASSCLVMASVSWDHSRPSHLLQREPRLASRTSEGFWDLSVVKVCEVSTCEYFSSYRTLQEEWRPTHTSPPCPAGDLVTTWLSSSMSTPVCRGMSSDTLGYLASQVCSFSDKR